MVSWGRLAIYGGLFGALGAVNYLLHGGAGIAIGICAAAGITGILIGRRR